MAHTFFYLNQPVIQFAYALTFFVMGFATALQSRRSSRLELARSLRWLAAFGILFSLYEWGELFVPVGEVQLNMVGARMLHSFHLLLLSVSLACLMEFGLALLRPILKMRWLEFIPAVLLLIDLFVATFVLTNYAPDFQTWHNMANALARYMIGFPAGLLAAYALREQAFHLIAPLEAEHIVDNLRAAGISLALFAFFGGLIPPPVPFFPGNFLNTVTFEENFGPPPLIFLSVIGLTLAVSIIRGLEIFYVETERRIEAMEQQQMLASERERIARELHDGAIQTVYTAGLLVESAQKLVDPDTVLANRLERAVNALNDAIRDLRRSLDDLHSEPSGESLILALKGMAQDRHIRSLVDISLDLQLSDDDNLSPVRSDHVLSILKEALSNVMRHANARNVNISAHSSGDRLVLVIRDDGRGIGRNSSDGYGTRNMRDRARLLGGSLDIQSKKGGGTRVTLDIPWKDER